MGDFVVGLEMYTAFTLFTIVLFALSSYAEVTQDEGVYVLGGDNFDSWLKEQDYALVEFYAPWCGHCKRLAPEFAQAAQELEADGSNIKFGKVDATEHPDLAQEYEVQGYPTLIWFTKENNHAPEAYRGGRESATIQSWVKKQTVSILDILPSQDDLKNILETAEKYATVVLYGEAKSFKGLVNMALDALDLDFFHITDESQFGDYKSGDIISYDAHRDPVSITYTADEELPASIKKDAYPSVVEFSPENFHRLIDHEYVLIAVTDYSKDGAKQELINLLKEVTTPERAEKFGVMYGDSAQLGRGVEGAGASGTVYPTMISVNTGDNSYIAFDEEQEFNSATVAKFADGLLDGTTTSFKKSEPIPEENDEAVTTLVAKNFDTIKGKNALVEYYAPWCGHCKSLAPVYEEAAASLKGLDVIVAKIDATANYVEEQIRGFPTLIWYGADGSSEPFEGDRTLEGIASFIKSKIGADAHGSHDEL